MKGEDSQASLIAETLKFLYERSDAPASIFADPNNIVTALPIKIPCCPLDTSLRFLLNRKNWNKSPLVTVPLKHLLHPCVLALVTDIEGKHVRSSMALIVIYFLYSPSRLRARFPAWTVVQGAAKDIPWLVRLPSRQKSVAFIVPAESAEAALAYLTKYRASGGKNRVVRILVSEVFLAHKMWPPCLPKPGTAHD